MPTDGDGGGGGGAGSPSPDDVPLTAEEAQMIADAMSPLQDLTGVGASVGSALEGTDDAGPQFLGTALKQTSTGVNFASQSAEAVSRLLQVADVLDAEGVDGAFPPPDELVAAGLEDVQPLLDLLDDLE